MPPEHRDGAPLPESLIVGRRYKFTVEVKGYLQNITVPYSEVQTQDGKRIPIIGDLSWGELSIVSRLGNTATIPVQAVVAVEEL